MSITPIRREEVPLDLAQLRRAFQDLPLALALVAPAGGLAWSNERFAALFGPARVAVGPLVAAARDGAMIAVRGREREHVLVRGHLLKLASSRLLVIEDRPGARDVEAFGSLCERVAQLEREVMVDSLTRAWNRRYLDIVLATEIARSRRCRQPLSALMMDIDHFKRVNDLHGHAAGDAALREFAARASGCLRSSDTLCRHGGEEFVALLPYTRHGDAAAVAEKLRAAVAERPFGEAGRVTVSIGAGELSPGEDDAAFLARLDANLYAAKEGGRDRVVCDPRGASDGWEARARGIVSITWDEAYASGNELVDDEHRELFRLGNELIAASLGGEREALVSALVRCLGHIASHFRHEERILAQVGYAGLARHQASHRALLERAAQLRKRCLAGEPLTGVLVEFLAHEVVARHMLTEDRDFFPLVARATGRAGV